MTAISNDSNGAPQYGPACEGAGELPSPAVMERVAQRELERAERYRRVFSLVLIELPAGDAREPALVSCLRATLRRHDAVGRFDDGGLLVVLPETPRGGAEACVRRLRQLAEPETGELQVGIASFPQDGQRWHELVRAAMSRVGSVEAPPVPNASPRGSLRGAFPSFYRGLKG